MPARTEISLGVIRKPWIIDTTLRDGEQAPGVVFNPHEKKRIAELLAETGVDEIEVGYPAISQAEREVIREIVAMKLPVRLTSWSRANMADIELAAACGTDAVHISFPASRLYLELMHKEDGWIQEQLHAMVSKAREWFDFVSVGGQDATRSDIEFLQRFMLDAETAGAERFRIADTVGVATPVSVMALGAALRQSSALPLEFHAHNDLGMATANAFTALESGFEAVSVSVTGLGERAGNAALEELSMALALSGGFASRLDTEKLSVLCDAVAAASGRVIQEQKPVVGRSAFEHESGIHCAALLQNPLSYQPFLPSRVGRGDFEMVIGKHSGTAAVIAHFSRRGISVSKEEARELLELIRSHADRLKRALRTDEIDAIRNSALIKQA
ncbi:homocitrate synthase [Chlorobaculum sp. 24CR]|uniref:homocitrate synthase n=1 Tax=Chlorobaculum sp. 24CR TaxID=2508878 RepID=UPI0014311325|nr:homocitrate synthase [Chlorobaculum sp. 24CR]